MKAHKYKLGLSWYPQDSCSVHAGMPGKQIRQAILLKRAMKTLQWKSKKMRRRQMMQPMTARMTQPAKARLMIHRKMKQILKIKNARKPVLGKGDVLNEAV